MSTAVDRKSPRKPSLHTQAINSITPVTSAINPAHASHCAESGRSPATPRPAMPDASSAAVAESAPTTISRDAPITANTSTGTISEYRPAPSGTCAMELYPIASGIATAASETPASTSARSHRGR
ncbi:hypothetical protein BKA16_000461 [Gordonia humi]|uniref:Uncharacterized protein n=1 Tax=Gordonia humi TaxID=686429 RepID=A0A840EY68_9ACTN|nr:hypothetical protein [Gordonia humi]